MDERHEQAEDDRVGTKNRMPGCGEGSRSCPLWRGEDPATTQRFHVFENGFFDYEAHGSQVRICCTIVAFGRGVSGIEWRVCEARLREECGVPAPADPMTDASVQIFAVALAATWCGFGLYGLARLTIRSPQGNREYPFAEIPLPSATFGTSGPLGGKLDP